MADNKELDTVNRVDIESLLKIAVDKSLPIEQMEKLLTMRRELKEEAAKDAFFEDLSRFQSVCPVIKKEKSVNYTSKKGGMVKYDYASLDNIVIQVRDILYQNGFSYTIKTKQDKEGVTAICCAHHKLGHTEETTFFIPIDYEAYMNAAQKVASALTYAKRYAFCNAFGIMTGDEDDDGNETGNRTDREQQEVNQSTQVQEKSVGKTIMPDKKNIKDKQSEQPEYITILEGFFQADNTNPAQKEAILNAVNDKDIKDRKDFIQKIIAKKESINTLDELINSLNIEFREEWIEEKERCKTTEDYKHVIEMLRDFIYKTKDARMVVDLNVKPAPPVPGTEKKEQPKNTNYKAETKNEPSLFY